MLILFSAGRKSDEEIVESHKKKLREIEKVLQKEKAKCQKLERKIWNMESGNGREIYIPLSC